MTLPIVETFLRDVSAYIPTNKIPTTDGQHSYLLLDFEATLQCHINWLKSLKESCWGDYTYSIVSWEVGRITILIPPKILGIHWWVESIHRRVDWYILNLKQLNIALSYSHVVKEAVFVVFWFGMPQANVPVIGTTKLK